MKGRWLVSRIATLRYPRAGPAYSTVPYVRRYDVLVHPRHDSVRHQTAVRVPCRAVLLLAGDVVVALAADKHWRELVHFCAENDAYRGCACNVPGVVHSAGSVAGLEDDGFLGVVARVSSLGDATRADMYPETLDQFYAEEAWRVML